ncbi:DNA-binding transcriptional regulator, MerR family [Streptococcus gallolyticus]|uniref:DNA-binding transcriptional regulator, MerR family n=1 Tax=Streptococcus gallolyticus TaxID=315405 RepID=A0A1I7FBV2_9STRE|nr:MerR family transcriptional regulator [Streptococcus gallolyticus]SFC05175.1 DNA-binding transcriptional regulator, MerR family [Streptococcus gallolyticus]SFU33678.1 DNA-binding transcriptional regulator, MerR family [Streptococcus gallolyticus]
MLKITQFAKLANTTRRTLLYYDKEKLFSPAMIDEDNGYRYYDYDQLYTFHFISGLRHLGLSLEDIKQLLALEDKALLDQYLSQYQQKLRQEIRQLEVLNHLLEERKSKPQVSFDDLELGQVVTLWQERMTFWSTQRAVDCEPEDLAYLFAEFCKKLGDLSFMAAGLSGFVTDLNLENPQDYHTAAFRFIKETSAYETKEIIAKMERQAGKYLSVKVLNTREGILSGLYQLKETVEKEGLHVSDILWQLNTDNQLVTNGASPQGVLQYHILEK